MKQTLHFDKKRDTVIVRRPLPTLPFSQIAFRVSATGRHPPPPECPHFYPIRHQHFIEARRPKLGIVNRFLRSRPPTHLPTHHPPWHAEVEKFYRHRMSVSTNFYKSRRVVLNSISHNLRDPEQLLNKVRRATCIYMCTAASILIRDAYLFHSAVLGEFSPVSWHKRVDLASISARNVFMDAADAANYCQYTIGKL